jgi:hypothetical protein
MVFCCAGRRPDTASTVANSSLPLSGCGAAGMALIALIMVALAENARILIDNPSTHPELTMVHEAMVLEDSDAIWR